METVGVEIGNVDMTAGFSDSDGNDLTFGVEFGRMDSGLTFRAEGNEIRGTLAGPDDVMVTVTATDGSGSTKQPRMISSSRRTTDPWSQ